MRRKPDVNAFNIPTASEDSMALRDGGYPRNPIVDVTRVVASAIPTTFPEFRIKFRKPEITPYRLGSTALKIELLFGALNTPTPKL